MSDKDKVKVVGKTADELGLDKVDDLPQNRDPRDAAFSLSVKDLEVTKKYLESKKVKTAEIRDIPNMVSLMDCWDPFGNQILMISEPRIKE